MGDPTKDDLLKVYAETKTIAVVGASGDESKQSHKIPRYLQSQGYRIIPVSPKGGEILGEKVYTSLAEIPEPVDVVDVFRPAEETPGIAERRPEARRRDHMVGLQHEVAGPRRPLEPGAVPPVGRAVDPLDRRVEHDVAAAEHVVLVRLQVPRARRGRGMHQDRDARGPGGGEHDLPG